jgi:ferredoxin
MSITVTVDLDSCQGYVCCLMEAPTVFDVDDSTGKVVLLQTQPAPALEAQVRAAARACPARAISVSG